LTYTLFPYTTLFRSNFYNVGFGTQKTKNSIVIHNRIYRKTIVHIKFQIREVTLMREKPELYRALDILYGRVNLPSGNNVVQIISIGSALCGMFMIPKLCSLLLRFNNKLLHILLRLILSKGAGIQDNKEEG